MFDTDFYKNFKILSIEGNGVYTSHSIVIHKIPFINDISIVKTLEEACKVYEQNNNFHIVLISMRQMRIRCDTANFNKLHALTKNSILKTNIIGFTNCMHYMIEELQPIMNNLDYKLDIPIKYDETLYLFNNIYQMSTQAKSKK